jgi:hypothetical protein
MTRLALIGAALWLAVTGSAGAKTLSGDIPAAPAKSWSTALTVEALSLHNGTVQGAVRPGGSHWSMTVPAGDYLVAALLSDSRAGSASLVDEHLAAATSLFPPRAASAAGGTVVGIGDIPIVPAAGAPLAPGGDASGGLSVGLLPACEKKNAKLVDRTQRVQDAQSREQSLSDQGLTPIKFTLQPLQPTVSVTGSVRLSNETAVADMKIIDARSGRLIKHVVVRGDASDFDSDLDGFLTFVGKGVGAIACEPPKKKPKPKPKPKSGTGLAFRIEYSGHYTDNAADSGNVHVNDVNMNWDEVLEGKVSRGGAVSAKPMKLTLSGTVTVQNNIEGAASSGQCSLTPGSTPVGRGGFINLIPRGRGSLLRQYSSFQAWASIPLTRTNGVIGYAPGSSSLCTRDDLRPFSGVPPDSFNAVSLALVNGRWRTPINKAENDSFTIPGGWNETVSVSARLRVTTSGALPRR